MDKRQLGIFGIATVIVIAAVGLGLFLTRGNHVDLKGKVLKVRTAPIDAMSSIVVADFRFANPSDYPFVVRSVTVTIADAAGKQTNGMTISEIDAQHVFQALPLLGEKYNRSLIARDSVPAHGSEDRMIAARFELPESLIDKRAQLLIHVEEADGNIAEITEK